MASVQGSADVDRHKTQAALLEGHAAEDEMPPCPLLDKLPPELRITIYDFAFAKDGNGEDPVNLQAHSSLDRAKGLLSTCSQIYAEASKLYKTAYREYWTDNRFYLQPAKPQKYKSMRGIIHHVREDDLDRITNLVLDPPYNYAIRGKLCRLRLVDRRGAWSVQWRTGSDKEPLCVVSRHHFGSIFEQRCSEKDLESVLDKVCQASMREQIEYLLSEIWS